MQELLPEYPINMVCVDIPITELQATRKNNIQPLLYPLNTVLDDSIGKTIFGSREDFEVAGFFVFSQWLFSYL